MPLDDDEIWKHFLSWLKQAEPSENPAALFRSYSASLQAAGVSPAEIDERRAVIQTFMRTHEDGWQLIFNKIYAGATPGFSTEPTALLAAAIENVKPGRALDAGMGQGRNAVFLAKKGWDVTGFDLSDEGIAIAKKNATAAGVKLKALRRSSDSFDYGLSRWDLIVATYVPFPLTTDLYANKLLNALRPGGLLVIESFASDTNAPNRRPVDIDPNALLKALEPFRIVQFEDAEGDSEWVPQKTRLVRIVAQRK